MNIVLMNHLKVLKFNIIGTLFMLVALFFLDFHIDAVKIFLAFWLMLSLPAFYLHMEYLFKNFGLLVKLEENELIVIQGNQSTSFKFSDMDRLILYKSASLDKGGIPLTPLESYHYARIITKSKEEIIITCLLFPKVDEIVKLLKGVPYERKRRLFCTISWK